MDGSITNTDSDRILKSFLVYPSVIAVLSRSVDMASQALCCFLCHGMVQFRDKNPSDFTNHMITQHKAFFNMELSLACSLMDANESQTIVKQHVFLKSNTNIKQEDEILLTEKQIKQESEVSVKDETNFDIKNENGEGEYIEVDDVLVKEEATYQDNSVQKPSPELQSRSTALSLKATTHKRPAEELLTDYEPRLKKNQELRKDETKQEIKTVTTSNAICYPSAKDFLESLLVKTELACPIGVDCWKICNNENELSSHLESVHSTDQRNSLSTTLPEVATNCYQRKNSRPNQKQRRRKSRLAAS